MDEPTIHKHGDAALLIRFAVTLDDEANRAAIAFRAALEDDPPAGVVETASSLGSVLVRFRGSGEGLVDVLRRRLDRNEWAVRPRPPHRVWTIPCAFGGDEGPQLDEAADLAGLTSQGAVDALSNASLRVLALGFAPGMPYLGTLPDAWNLPRQTELTPRVPEGALVVALRQVVLFGTSAPTGWRRVGLSRFGCFQPGRRRPIALTPGDEIRLEPVSAAVLHAIDDPEGHGGARWNHAA